MQGILDRLNVIERQSHPSPSASQPATGHPVAAGAPSSPGTPPVSPPRTNGVRSSAAREHAESAGKSVPQAAPASGTAASDQVTADALVNALRSINNSVRSNQPYFISNFDPNLHDIEVWCKEVDRAKATNNWTDNECLSRIGNCLKGEARIWLNEWITNDRSWTAFKKEFKPLCPKKPDVANILFDVMKTTSDHYPTYADYARRSLLRLRVVSGLSEELISAIVVRGITDPQIRAAATNAKLMPNDLVEFFSIYVKSASTKTSSSVIAHPAQNNRNNSSKFKRPADNNRKRRYESGKCFSCGLPGHVQASCPKKSKTENISNSNIATPSTAVTSTNTCSFCKKPGHKVETCFAKIKSESRNKDNVNFCREIEVTRNSDIMVAVIQGVPVDVLIDSGSTISLASSELVKHFDCPRKPAFRVLKGIGSQEVESTYFVTLPIEFSDLTLEVDLFVVDAMYMNTPVIIGTDVLNREGITYVRTRDRQCITRDGGRDYETVLTVESSEQLPINTELAGEDLTKLLNIIRKFSSNLITGTAVSTVNTGNMSIKLNNNTPVNYRPYRLSHAETLRVRGIVKDLLDKNIIQESESEYASPILLVTKKDGSDRLCVDYRKLNEVTVKDRFPLPLIDDHIDRLGRHKFFSSLDMATGFHQIPMDKDSVPLTGFVTPEGHFEYLKMPYGLANAPVVYQRIITKTLRHLIDSGKVLVYIDDVLIMSETTDEGLTILHEVLSTLTNAGFSINLKKCSFLMTKVEYLGRTISQGQVQPSKQKVKALAESPVPKNVKQIRQFLGLAGYFRKYIAGFSSKIACIAHLTKKNVPFIWGSEQEAARQEIIAHLTSEPVLAIYDPRLPIEVHTDASSVGYGAVLLQTHESGHKRVVGYFSKLTQGAESKYHSYELETLAVVKALQHFRHYLVGSRFTVVTDCNALKLTQKKKDLMPRVARWWMYLQDFDFSLEYRKGTSMSHADYLSRNPVNVVRVEKPQSWAQIAQAADEETQTLMQKLNEGHLDSNQYVKKNDLLYYRYRPIGEEPRLLCFIPKGHRLSLLRVFHDEHGHVGAEKTCDLILKHFWFPGIRPFVQKYVSHCIVCLAHKKSPRSIHQPIHSYEKPDCPFETIHLDALGPLPDSNGHRFVLIIVDAFSKYCLLYPMMRQEASELKRHFANAISLFGAPKLIVADRGRMIQSNEFLSWVNELGSEVHLITPEMHHSNGQVERYCRTLLNLVRIETNYRREEWAKVMWKLQLTINITKHKTTQCSPLSLLIGVDAMTPVIRNIVRDIAVEGTNSNREALRVLTRQRVSQRLKKNREQQDSSVNRHRRSPRDYEVGSLVFVIKQSQSTGKLDSGMRGPYRVLKALPHGRYELQLVAGSYGKTTQAAAEYMLPWRGEWTPDTCAAYFESKHFSCCSTFGTK